MASVMWKELTAADLRELASRDATVILPVASIEQHGPHLPVGVDTILCEAVCKLAAEAVQDDMPIVVAPTLWCGMAEHHMAFGGTFTFDIPTYRAVILAVLKSLARHGFTKVFIVNGHGGNISALAAFLADFEMETGLKVRATTYFELAQPGMPAILWVVAIVITSDVAGYFVGRIVGGPKFWPAISPKKTWSGTVAGWVGAVLVSLAFVLAGHAPWMAVILAPVVAFAGQLGDIAESWIKRRAGVKDSSSLIPGHGGFLDRFDALIGAVVLIMLLSLIASLPMPVPLGG